MFNTPINLLISLCKSNFYASLHFYLEYEGVMHKEIMPSILLSPNKLLRAVTGVY